MKKTTPVTLAFIAWNEEAVIERFIRSFSKVADCMVMCLALGDTKPDRTREIARKTCDELGISLLTTDYINKVPGLSHADSFCDARNTAWTAAENCKPSGKYLMWADCDDLIDQESADAILSAVADTNAADVLIVPYHVKGDKQTVMRERLVKNERISKWIHPIHEQMSFSRDCTYRLLSNAKIDHAPTAEKTGSSDRNMEILSRAFKDSWRNAFYLHMEHFTNKQNKDAKTRGLQVLADPECETLERYEVLLNLAQLEDGPQAKKYAAEAFALMPDRREALALLACYSIIDENYTKAFSLAKLMMSIDRPPLLYWSLNNDWYRWKGIELYNQCARLAGKDTLPHAEPTFSIVHATYKRAQQALAIRELWLSNADHPEQVEYIFGAHEGDEATLKAVRGFIHTTSPSGSGAPTNYDYAAGISTGDIIIQAQDDCLPPKGWDTAILNALGNDTKSPAFIGTNDGYGRERVFVNSIMTRSYMNQKAKRDTGENGFMHRGYSGVFADTENSMRAEKDSKEGNCRFIKAMDVVIFHDHPHYNPEVVWDEAYENENSSAAWAHGLELFKNRNPNVAIT